MTTDSAIQAIQWRNEQLVLLDQRLLPGEETYLTLGDAPAVADAIRNMVVRGAPAIGICAAFGVVLALLNHQSHSSEDRWRNAIAADLQALAESRPTAVNLFWALSQMQSLIDAARFETRDILLQQATQLADQIHQDDIQMNQAMGEYGAVYLTEQANVITHCNTGSLATGGYGTALGVIRSAYAQGRLAHVYADETRPWLQGSRLTAWELVKDHIPVTLLADGAAAFLMQQKHIQWLIVGSDCVAANGDFANKIGTYSAAVNAKHHGVKVMVVAPSSTFNRECQDGKQLVIEYRSSDELKRFGDKQIAPSDCQVWNPVFDVTPASLVDVLVCEKGAIENPSREAIAALLD